MTANEILASLNAPVVRVIVAAWREKGVEARQLTKDPRCLAVYDELEKRGEGFARELEAAMG